MTRLAMVAAVAAVLAGPAAEARADLLKAMVEIHAGGAGGQGVGGDRKDDAFHAGAQGGVYGFLLGAEVLWIDGWIEHNQYTDGELLGTWTQLMVGADLDVDLGGGSYMELGGAVGFGVGTGQQVEPPLDAAQVTDKGAVLQFSLGAGYKLNPMVSIGISVPAQLAYLIKSGDGAAANDLGTHYTSMHAAALVNLRLSFGR